MTESAAEATYEAAFPLGFLWGGSIAAIFPAL